MKNIPYKSFCWNLGTTSFRTKNFNRTIEKQLELLNDFFQREAVGYDSWNGNNQLQEKYYDYMKKHGFVDGEAKNKAKDAREKTSGLVDIGLIYDNRLLTSVGKHLLEISKANDFEIDNPLQISKDSFLYLKQLLKTFYYINGKCVRPYIVLLYVLSKVDYLTTEEFTYLLPLCIDVMSTDNIVEQIKQLRLGNITIDEIIVNKLMNMGNYQEALNLFMSNIVDENLMCQVGMNRKSREYDKSYYPLYCDLFELFVDDNLSKTIDVYSATKNIKIGKYWRMYLFDTQSESAILNDPKAHIKQSQFINVKNEEEFKKVFFLVMHLFKAKATLADYLDLNKRYIKTTDIILFEDDVVKLDIVAKYYFNSVIDKLYLKAFSASKNLCEDCSLMEIDESLIIEENVLIKALNEGLKLNISDISQAKLVYSSNRYQRFEKLVDKKFSDEKLLLLLELFEKRDDKKIQEMVSDNADIPTIFEYVLGVLWYKISERKGRILDYLKLSLDADLLPKSHAIGGEADIVYEYEKTRYYPKHTLLLEATLSDKNNQRRMEMEPVSRHLGKHLIKVGNLDTYCIFATNYLDINVISDFRSRKTTLFYDTQDFTQYVEGMKIIPLEITELKNIIKGSIKYKDLYPLFEIAYDSSLPPHKWYKCCIKDKLESL